MQYCAFGDEATIIASLQNDELWVGLNNLKEEFSQKISKRLANCMITQNGVQSTIIHTINEHFGSADAGIKNHISLYNSLMTKLGAPIVENEESKLVAD